MKKITNSELSVLRDADEILHRHNLRHNTVEQVIDLAVATGTNPDEEPVYDVNAEIGRQAFPGKIRAFVENADQEIWCPGISKREYFAGLAMQGILSNDWRGYADKEDECTALAKASVNFADALIEQLNTPPNRRG